MNNDSIGKAFLFSGIYRRKAYNRGMGSRAGKDQIGTLAYCITGKGKGRRAGRQADKLVVYGLLVLDMYIYVKCVDIIVHMRGGRPGIMVCFAEILYIAELTILSSTMILTASSFRFMRNHLVTDSKWPAWLVITSPR